ncbi:MAG: hypothetical protein GF334_11150 [Candidatus Altiarchaeales archaeon]|nr:hypothetical protein [Candidatus Altiarchaeales archaeon]
MELLYSLLFVFFAVLASPSIAKRIGIPAIVVEILFGILLGVSFLNIIPDDPTTGFLKSFGLVYLLFLAGIEMDFQSLKGNILHTLRVSVFSIITPFLAGMAISSYVGVHPLLMGTVLSTTSLGVIVPLVREFRGDKRFSNILLGSAILVDIASMFLLSFSISYMQGDLTLSFFYSSLFIVLLFIAPWAIKRGGVAKKAEKWICEESHCEQGVRFSFAVIVLLAVVSEGLGFHSVIGAFIAGLLIYEFLPHERHILQTKLEGFGYGFFIPLFFIIVGSEVDLPAVFSNLKNIEALIAIVFVGILAKVVGVGATSYYGGFNLRKSVAMGFLHATQLSLIIAAAEIGLELGYLNEELFSMLIILSVTSSIICPTAGRKLISNHETTQKQ